MQRRVERELADADAALLVVDGHQGVGPGDRFIARALLGAKQGTPVVCAVNKCDRLGSPQTAAALAAAAELQAVDELFPVSARTGAGLEPLTGHLATLLPEGPFAYPPEDRQTSRARFISPSWFASRCCAARARRSRTRSRWWSTRSGGVSEADGDLVEVRAQIWVETQSQKGILVGKGGRMVREIGTAARRELERELGAQVFLDLQVKVREHWRRDDALLDRLGID